MKWNPQSKKPRVFRQYKSVSFPASTNKNCPLTHSVSLKVRRSKDVLMRSRHGKTHYRLGDEGWKDYPDPQAGKYKYVVGWFIIYEGAGDNDEDLSCWECEDDAEMGDEGWEWTPLPNCVAAGYTW